MFPDMLEGLWKGMLGHQCMLSEAEILGMTTGLRWVTELLTQRSAIPKLA